MKQRGSGGKKKMSITSDGGLKSPVEDTLLYATKKANEVMGATGSGIMFFDPDSRSLGLQYPALDSSRDNVSLYKVPVDGVGAAVRTFHTRQPYIANHCPSDPVVIHRYTEMYGVEKLLTLPLVYGPEVLGIWHIADKRDSCWEESDINRFADMARPLAGLIAQARQWQLQERRHQIWLSLMQKIASNGDVQSVAEVLGHVLGAPLLVVDRWGRCRASVGLSAGKMTIKGDNLKYLSRLNTRSGLVRILPSVENQFSRTVWVAPLGSLNKTSGYLVVLADENHHFDEIMLSQASLVLVAALNNEDRLAGVIERLSSDFLDRLVRGMLSEDEAYMRAGRLGLDLRCGWVTVLAIPDLAPTANGEIQKLWQRLLVARDMLWRQLEDVKQECWLGVTGDCSVVVYVGQPSDGAVGVMPEELTRSVQQALRRYVGTMSFSIGVGEMVCSRPSQFPEAYREAKKTVEIGRKLNGHGQVTYCNSLGASLLLYDTDLSGASSMFVDRLLNRLIDHDQKHGSQLLDTLEAYLEEGGSIAAAARLMHTHVNTVRYRLARVEELTGRSLKNHKNRFEFQLTLQIRKLR